jgi:hypothetical protein
MPVHRVSVSARLIDFPARCACCGEPHDRTVHATAGRSGGERRNWAVPYCDRCLRHHEAGPVLREASDGVRSATVWLVVCLSLSAAASALAVASPSCGAPLLATCLLLAAVFWLFRRSRVSWRDEVGRELTRTFRRGCACEGPAVRYEGWSGSVHTFAFASEPYAADFERLNLAKVVQAPPVPVSVAARERSAPAKDTRAAATLDQQVVIEGVLLVVACDAEQSAVVPVREGTRRSHGRELAGTEVHGCRYRGGVVGVDRALQREGVPDPAR